MKATIIWCLLGFAAADLRQASQPKKAFRLLQQGGGRGSQNFAVGSGQNNDGTTNTENKGKVLYMEPSIFGYKGLARQRQNNYDNFLRSNIDNEQDNRNFNNEPGRDHLPFRTFETAVETKYPYKGTEENGAADDSLQVNNLNVDTVLRVAPGEPKLTPLRWNNPHASEVEVNLWIMCADPPTIVPVKKPSCSGEGNQNNIMEWAIPSDFNDVNWAGCPATKCFKGCKNAGDCVLQIYAHSVETRQYSTSVPIIVTDTPWTGRKLSYNPAAKDSDEVGSFSWPSSYDLKAMVTGKQAGNPRSGAGVKTTGSLDDVRLCASGEREGVSTSGDSVYQVQLEGAGATPKTLAAATVHLYLCKQTDRQRAGEKLVDRVVFEVSSSAGGTGAFTPGPTKIENYSPFEMSSTTQFGGAALKKVKATLSAYSGQSKVVEVLLDLSNPRRHLQASSVCPGGLKEPFADPWMDLSKLKRETCLSAQDPHSNYPKTTVQRAVLHSDVANHAYQNSNYSPYSGQQHGEISRNLQAAAVVHMTSGNRGELGKNNLPNQVKQTLKKLNRAVNKIYKTYEKVANKVIDDLTRNGGKNGGDTKMGVQALGSSFRSAEKGATSTKRLKTTTYVPSFSTQGYSMAVIENAIKSRTQGRTAKYADLLSAPKPGTGRRYIEIYQATMNQMLPAFAQAEALGITYMPSVQMTPCSVVQSAKLRSMSSASLGASRQATACCTGSLQEQGEGKCGSTLPDITNFMKRNAQNKKDGGQYAAKTFNAQRYMTLYSCPAACLQQDTASTILAAPVTKTSKGTCITWHAGSAGCVASATGSATDCRPCAGIFNNVAPPVFSSDFKIGDPRAPKGELESMIKRVRSAAEAEPLGNVLRTAGDPLVEDDTAVCHTPSTFTCPGGDAGFEASVAAGKCKEEESAKIDSMCDDGPCDSDPMSVVCVMAKAKCEVDPDSGVKCMPGSDNDPCKDCERTIEDGGEAASVAVASLLVVALVSML